MAVNVYLWASLKKFTNDKDILKIEATTIGELVSVTSSVNKAVKARFMKH